ncbi:MAG: DUF2156 domain-containing protein [Oscillospiraceae bacterium]|nr:DUF2156 domain-containing protein [Oscillospiraceae bacterium]
MLSFEPITPSHRPLLHNFFLEAKGHGSEYSFANLFFWGDQQVCADWKVPLVLSRFGTWTAYLYPRDPECIPLLSQDAKERNLPLRLWGLTLEEARELEHLYPGRFQTEAFRDGFDYVYEIERLCSLGGKKLQSKRNHCNRFLAEHPNYEVRELTPELLPLCHEFTLNWYEAHAHLHDPSDYDRERIAIEKAFCHFHELQMEGLALFDQGALLGFSMGNRIREDTFDVNYEKALAAVNGAYPMVNREFARHLHQKYPEIRFLNREDDMGIEGLRRAKESYYPDILLEKYVAEEIL